MVAPASRAGGALEFEYCADFSDLISNIAQILFTVVIERDKRIPPLLLIIIVHTPVQPHTHSPNHNPPLPLAS